MSSSSTTISSKHSTMNNNNNHNRKRSISSSIRPSPPPPSAKRRGLSSSMSRKSTKPTIHRSEQNKIGFKKTTDQNERQSRLKQQYRHIDNKSSSSDSSRSSSNSININEINQEYSTSTIRTHHKPTTDIKRDDAFNENTSTKKAHLNSMNNSNQKSDIQTDTIYTKKATSIALIVKPTTATIIDQRNLVNNYDSDEEFERTKQTSNKVLTKSTHVVIPSNVMTIVTTPDLSKKSMRTDTNVIVQQFDGNINPKLVKLVVPQSTNSSSSIKMLSSGDGLASALRVPTKIQLTKTSLVPLIQNDKISPLISSTSMNQDQSTSLFDIPIDMTNKQQSGTDYHSSSTLPPTPPPPVIDNTNRNVLSHSSIQKKEQEKINDISTINNIKETVIDEHSNDQIMSKRHSSHIDHPSAPSDWSIPPTSELSPTSLTSSSPDLSQNHLPIDDSLIELDSTINSARSSTKGRHRSLSSSCPILPTPTQCCLQSNESLIQPIKSKSLTRLSNSSNRKSMLINSKRSLTSSPIMKLSSSQRLKKRRRENENFLLHQSNGKIYKSKTKQIKYEHDNQSIIQDILNDVIERIIMTTNDEKDNALKTLLVTPIRPSASNGETINNSIEQMKAGVFSRATSANKKSRSLSQSLDLTTQNESRSMTMTSRELDELAYLLHANVRRGEFERIGNPAKVEERMREMWSQMSNQKKNSYYKRVIQIYKRPNRNVIIASSSTLENTSNDSSDNTNSPSITQNSLSRELKRQTSTPLSFHSIASSTTTDDQSIVSPQESNLKTNICADIVNELIKGAKGLDKLSCSPTVFTNLIHNFVRSTIDKQTETIKNLQRQVEKKCSQQLIRATIFWTEKINYFASKHLINSTNDSMNELTLIVKYFYLLVLSLNCRKQEAEFEAILTDLLSGKLTFNESFCSPILTSIIEDLILRSSLANDYLASQTMIINQTEYSLPFIRNIELEHDLFNKNETVNPFSDLNDLEDYLNRCEHMTTTTIPCYPVQQSHHPSMYYPQYHHPPQYYYPQSSDVNNFYYNPPTVYSNSQQMYQYGQPTAYYHPPPTTYSNNEQINYYYNQQQQSSYSYSSQTNSTNDIPLANNPSHHRAYQPMNMNMQRKYSNTQQPSTPSVAPTTPGTPAVFDTTTVVSPQSKPMNTTTNNYPP